MILLPLILMANMVSTMKKNVFLIGPASESMLQKLDDANLEVHKASGMADPAAWLQEHGSLIDYVLTNGHDGLNDAYLSHLPNLQLISCNGVGYDSINVATAASRKILVTHTPHVLNAETSTTAILLMLACYRNFASCHEYARSGKWHATGRPHSLTRTADRRRVGLLGMGRIGQAIAEKLLPFGASISYHSTTRKQELPYAYFDNLLEMAHAVECLICIVPGGEGTKHLVNDQVMNALGPEGVLINVARGSVVDEEALITALEEGRLGGAGLDVFQNEPYIPEKLRTMDNVVVLPHVGSATVETRAAMGALTVDNIISHARNGRVLTPVPECTELVKASQRS
jgi:lactate dehydrogenase-like 2-hydroxyacid dehydrogenase